MKGIKRDWIDKFSATACFVFISTAIASHLLAATIHVPADQPTIQAAIDVAGPGDVVMLADQTFTGDGNRDVDFKGKAITVRSASDDPLACIIDCEGSSNDPHRGFLFTTGETTTSVLRGVTITNGYDVANSQVEGHGGGIYCTTSPRIMNCRFIACMSIGWWTYDGLGGAVYSTGDPEFVECVFEDNIGDDEGGAVHCGGSPSFSYCRFVNNRATSGGAAFHGAGSCVFTDCEFDGNYGLGSGGAVEARGSAELLFERCAFTSNIAETDTDDTFGGAFSGGVNVVSTFLFCDFLGNESGYQGGAVYTPSPTFQGCLFANNVAHDGYSGFGGYGGAVYCYGESTFESCTFAENAAENAGAIAHSGIDPLDITQTIICFSGEGGAIWSQSSSGITITCTDIHGNSGGDWTGVIAGQAGTGGNFSADPLFCGELGSGIYTLQDNSPCASSNNDCSVLIGARSVDCTSTPNFITDFQAEIGMDQIALSWQVSAAGEIGLFQLEGAWNEKTWQVPYSAVSPGRFQALDRSSYLRPGRMVSYFLYWVNDDGGRQLLRQLHATVTEAAPRTGLTNVYPNPFNPHVTIGFSVARPQLVYIDVLDLSGRLVARLAGKPYGTGTHTVVWQGLDSAGVAVASGTYLVQVHGEDRRESRRITLVR